MGFKLRDVALLSVPVVILIGMWGAASSADGARSRGGWKDTDAPRRIVALAEPYEARWPGITTFLLAKAYWESGGNSRAVGAVSEWGWFQMLPASRCWAELGIDPGTPLEAEQVAAAVCHARVLADAYSAPGQLVRWEDVAAGWAKPKWVRDLSQRAVRDRFRQALREIGAPESFARQPVYGGAS